MSALEPIIDMHILSTISHKETGTDA